MRCSPPHAWQVLVNLLTNAAKHTLEGTISLSVSIAPPERLDHVELCFTVKDTGVGVPEVGDSFCGHHTLCCVLRAAYYPVCCLLHPDSRPAQPCPTQASRATIFEAFTQADVANHGAVNAGTGLGLPLCQALVALMGGHLRLLPQGEHGSTFTFSVVVKREHDAPLPRPNLKPAAEAPVAFPEGLRVLIADDHPVNRRLLARSLQSVLPEGTHFEQAGSGEEALALLLHRDKGFDIALVDEHFGNGKRLRGTEVTERVREHERVAGECRRLIMIGVTGNQSLGMHNASALTTGQDAVWGKPFPRPVQMRDELLGLFQQHQ